MTNIPKIAVIMSTTRAGRFADIPAAWLCDLARARGDMEIELIDLRDYPLPFFDEAASNLYVPAKSDMARKWQEKVAEFDGYIFVTAEYNRGISGVLKNALDYAYPEWNRKSVACLGYGSVGGARAIEQLRLNCVELQMAPIRHGVHIQGVDFYEALQNSKPLDDIPFIAQNAVEMLEELHWWTMALKTARAGTQ